MEWVNKKIEDCIMFEDIATINGDKKFLLKAYTNIKEVDGIYRRHQIYSFGVISELMSDCLMSDCHKIKEASHEREELINKFKQTLEQGFIKYEESNTKYYKSDGEEVYEEYWFDVQEYNNKQKKNADKIVKMVETTTKTTNFLHNSKKYKLLDLKKLGYEFNKKRNLWVKK
ncbi:MAG: hypothetical protein GON13_02145 [Nanoarchaeota archaeon]|nr:hypothetical protein [Nanoarchaeota archaeon]